ncbi:dihydrofolate reductase family protein, partial [Streptomyces olivaceoviridis]
TLVRALIAAELVDELRLVVMPVLLGGGKSVFPTDGGLRSWELVSSATAKTGAQVNVYRPAGRS